MPNYEPIYSLTAKLQDMQSRQNILNKRLKIVEELYSILTDELDVKLSSKLETIIVLIAIEVTLGLTTQLQQYFLNLLI
jgi:uncharacterized Rmd1/YagE family protein